MAQVPTESPPMGIKNVGIQHLDKRKHATTSDGSREVNRPWHMKTRPLDALERPHVSVVGFGPIRKRIVTAFYFR